MVINEWLGMSSIFVIFSMGRPKHVRVMAGGVEGELFLGPKAEVISVFILCLNYLMAKNFQIFNNCHGRLLPVTDSWDWPTCKSLWQHNLRMSSLDDLCDVTDLRLLLRKNYRVCRRRHCIILSVDLSLGQSNVAKRPICVTTACFNDSPFYSSVTKIRDCYPAAAA